MADTAEDRSTGLGGSELDDALNIPPYGCARRLVFQKRKTPPDYPEDNALVLMRGRAIEPLIVERYLANELAKGRKLKAVRRPRVTHPKVPWATASVDRELLGDPAGVGVLEAKSHNVWMFRKYATGGMPDSHILQLAWYLWVRDRQWGAFAMLCPDTWQFLTFKVARDDGLVEAVLPRLETVWRQIEHGPLPDALDPKDPRCPKCAWRKTCHGGELVAAIPAADRGVALERDEAVAPLLADLRDAKTWAAEAEDVVEQIKERVRDAIGDRPGVECSGFRVYHREQVSMRIDTAGLRAMHPEIAKEFEWPVKSRPLRIFPT